MDDAANIFAFIRVGGLVTALILLVAVWFGGGVINRTFERLGDRFVDQRLRIQQVGTFVRFALYASGIVGAALVTFKLSDQMVLALGGTIAVTVGFAFKDLAASVIAGLTILVDRPFQVGDRVSFAGFYGDVTSIGLRSVRLTTLDDNLITIPNNKFLTDAVSSGNAGELNMLVQTDFFIGLDEDVALAKRIVADAITVSRYVFLKKPWAVLTTQRLEGNYLCVRLRAKVYVMDTKYEKAMESEITERVMAGFREAGIAPPAVLHREAGSSMLRAERAA